VVDRNRVLKFPSGVHQNSCARPQGYAELGVILRIACSDSRGRLAPYAAAQAADTRDPSQPPRKSGQVKVVAGGMMRARS
jgi:hypothetical protein